MSRPPYRFSQRQIAQVRKLWSEGKPKHYVCHAIGVTCYQFEYARQNGVFRCLKVRTRGGKGVTSSKDYKPSPEQIKKSCDAIRKKWSKKDKAERWGGLPYGGPMN